MSFFYILVGQTNLYAVQYRGKDSNLPPHTRANEWFDTTRAEMKHFLALSLLVRIVRKPELPNYWSTNGMEIRAGLDGKSASLQIDIDGKRKKSIVNPHPNLLVFR